MEAPSEAPARIKALRATLQPDGSIEIEAAVPGWDEPVTLTTNPNHVLMYRIGMDPVPIDLEEGDDGTSRMVQDAVRRHIAKAEQELERQHAYEQARRQTVGGGKRRR